MKHFKRNMVIGVAIVGGLVLGTIPGMVSPATAATPALTATRTTVAFQASNGVLWGYSSSTGIGKSLVDGMAPGTSPSMAG